jgi:hypothetical protein
VVAVVKGKEEGYLSHRCQFRICGRRSYMTWSLCEFGLQFLFLLSHSFMESCFKNLVTKGIKDSDLSQVDFRTVENKQNERIVLLDFIHRLVYIFLFLNFFETPDDG